MKTYNRNLHVQATGEINVTIGKNSYTNITCDNGKEPFNSCISDGQQYIRCHGITNIELPAKWKWHLTKLYLHAVSGHSITLYGESGCEKVVTYLQAGTTDGTVTASGDVFFKHLHETAHTNAFINNLNNADECRITHFW